MKRLGYGMAAMLALLMQVSLSWADDVAMPLQAAGDCCCDSCSGGFVFDFEATFLRFHQEGGVIDFNGSSGEFGFDFAPRFELGYVSCDGVGVRGRYWSYDHDTLSVAGELIAVDTSVLDFEIFRSIELSCATSLEVAGGVRYVEFDQFLGGGVDAISHFDGLGLTVGLNFKHQVLCGNVYTKARWSIVMGDITTDTGAVNTGLDHTVNQVELGVGYEIARCLTNGAILRVRAGVEVQQWLSIAPVDDVDGFVGDDDTVADVGFGGFVIGVGLDY